MIISSDVDYIQSSSITYLMGSDFMGDNIGSSYFFVKGFERSSQMSSNGVSFSFKNWTAPSLNFFSLSSQKLLKDFR
jgi:hypothetical protein